VAEFAIIDEIYAGFLLAADDVDHGALQFFFESCLVCIFDGARVSGFDELRRPRQAADMGGQYPISHIFPPDLYDDFVRALRRACETPRAIFKVYRIGFAVGKACATRLRLCGRADHRRWARRAIAQNRLGARSTLRRRRV
jgi:hypothetical protein